ncbi:hypothetical protein ACK1X7_00490 [Streptomyces sp. CY1]|uniref:hypothetical protein n=1 Tax=unclassified Streptomyces TaxID=2593676 RepID=UPI003692B6C2
MLADAFSDFDCEASLKRIAQLAVSRATDEMDHCAPMVKAESGSRARSQYYGRPVCRQAATDLDRLSSEVVRDTDAVDVDAGPEPTKLADAVCRPDASTDEDYGHVPRPDPARAAELEEHFA